MKSIHHLLLQCEDVRHTTTNRVSDPSLSFIRDRGRSRAAAADGQVGEELGDVAGSEHLVHGREVGFGVVVPKVRREYAVILAFSSQELACSA